MVLHPDTLHFVAVRSSWIGLGAAIIVFWALLGYGRSLQRISKKKTQREVAAARERGRIAAGFACLLLVAWTIAAAAAHLFATW